MGASSGIGREVARLLLQQGWCVGVAARRIERLDELCSAFPQLAVAETIDVTSQNAAERLRTLIDRLGGMDIYIHSSGVGWQNVTLDAELDQWSGIYENGECCFSVFPGTKWWSYCSHFVDCGYKRVRTCAFL